MQSSGRTNIFNKITGDLAVPSGNVFHSKDEVSVSSPSLIPERQSLIETSLI